jgi:hypothetical protein
VSGAQQVVGDGGDGAIVPQQKQGQRAPSSHGGPDDAPERDRATRHEPEQHVRPPQRGAPPDRQDHRKQREHTPNHDAREGVRERPRAQRLSPLGERLQPGRREAGLDRFRRRLVQIREQQGGEPDRLLLFLVGVELPPAQQELELDVGTAGQLVERRVERPHGGGILFDLPDEHVPPAGGRVSEHGVLAAAGETAGHVVRARLAATRAGRAAHERRGPRPTLEDRDHLGGRCRSIVR